jgi:hypothetical protein
VVTYEVIFPAGKATTASAKTEAVIVLTSLLLFGGFGSKGVSDTLTITWTHTLLGA